MKFFYSFIQQSFYMDVFIIPFPNITYNYNIKQVANRWKLASQDCGLGTPYNRPKSVHQWTSNDDNKNIHYNN
uniref:Uncharacterized protein n=1 Tax=Pararge aegeria TaxID=116150 RepID=S4PG33_9NEOP